MSNINLIIEERTANIGKFMVGRLLPFREKRMVGPFIFIDHMGPVKLSERDNFDVGPHPHIGLSTLTYLFEGSIMHRDTLGTEVEINPGAVNWMTAGKGIVHSERTPQHLRHSDKTMHGLQIWVALPRALEQMDPEFVHIEKEQIPQWKEGDLSYKLIAGEACGKSSPVPVYSRLYMIEIRSKTRQTIDLAKDIYGESGLYILEGRIESDGHIYEKKQILVTTESSLCKFDIHENTTIYIFGGEPFPEERFIDWNFVASDKSLIEAAKQKWINRDVATIKGEEEDFIPYPIPK